MVIAGVFVGFGISNGTGKGQSAQRVGVASRVAAGTQASASADSASKTSPAQRAQLALPGLTRPLRDMVRVPAGKHHVKRELSRAEGLGAVSSSGRTAAVQTKAGAGHMPAPIQNFDGISRICDCLPPDTEGDVGPNHYMQWGNQHFAIYTKAGAQVGTTQPGNALWVGNANAPVCAANNDGDPIVLYDQYSGRWLASQFALPNYPSGPFYQCVAVSTSSDPSGTWCGYEYNVSANKLNDYPKFGVWPTQHAYMATINQFIAPSFSWGGVGITGPLGRHAPSRRRRLDATTGECARSADRGRRRRVGPAEFPGGSTRRLERDRGLDSRNPVAERDPRGHPSGCDFRWNSVRFRPVRPAAGDGSEAGHARRPAHVPDGIPELR
jgi:hypothetical protein